MGTFVRILSFVYFDVNIEICLGTVRLVATGVCAEKTFTIYVVGTFVFLSVRGIREAFSTPLN